MGATTNQPQTPADGALDLGEIEPGTPAGYLRPAEGAHPWAPSEFDRRAAPTLEEQAAANARVDWDRPVGYSHASRIASL